MNNNRADIALKRLTRKAKAYRKGLAQMIEGLKGYDEKEGKRKPYVTCYKEADAMADEILSDPEWEKM